MYCVSRTGYHGYHVMYCVFMIWLTCLLLLWLLCHVFCIHDFVDLLLWLWCHVFFTQEELASLRRKLERVKKIELASSADEVLMEEIKEYKVQIYVLSYDIQFRVYLQNVSHISIAIWELIFS